jgi:ech hydrogenase subunit C
MSYITKSPWIIHYDGSSCNGCDIEVLACLTPMYDVERFGVINTGNPKHADIFLITGSINEQNISVVKQIYEQMPEPKVVAAIGICATSGGVFRECYNIMGGVDTVIPVDVYVPGCAARPEAIIDGVVQALGALDEKKKAMERRPHETVASPADGSGTDDEPVIADGAPPEPPEEPVLPGDDVEVKYFGAAPEGEESEPAEDASASGTDSESVTDSTPALDSDTASATATTPATDPDSAPATESATASESDKDDKRNEKEEA